MGKTMTPPPGCACTYTLVRSHRQGIATGDPYTYQPHTRNPECTAPEEAHRAA